MAVFQSSAVLVLLVSSVFGQYGPPQGKTRHRTTTTTEIPDAANEVLPPSPYQPPPGYRPPQEKTPGQYPSPYQQPGPSTQQGEPPTPYQTQPSTPSQPEQPTPPGSYPYQPSPPSTSGQPQGQSPTPYQPSPYQPEPSTPSQPGYPSSQGQPSPSPYQPQPSTPSRPAYPFQPANPSTPGQPQGQSPTPYQPQPSTPNQPGPPGSSPYQPPGPTTKGQPTPQGQPSTSYQPQPSPYSPYQPEPQPAPSSPGYGSPPGPSTGPQGPVGPQGPIGPQAYPQQPYQPAPQNVPQSVLDYQQFQSPRPQKPQNQFWWSNPQSSPFKPGAKPQSSYSPQQPSPGCTSRPQPSRPAYPPVPGPVQAGPQLIPIPENNKPNPINPGNPFLQTSLQNPIRVQSEGPVCTAEQAYCVPSNLCYNGIVSDAAAHPTKKGPCSPGEVCCKARKPITTVPGYPNQPLPRPQYATESPNPKYTGPLNTAPPKECAAALKCVDILYCTVEGVMSNSPVALTREQAENRVPLADCQDVNTGIIGKCCRDPNYKDPWPAGMMMPKVDSGFDDGQYHPPLENTFDDGQYHPVSPRPGQTHAQVFPGNEDKLFPKPAPLTPHHSTGQPLPYQPQPQSPYFPQPQPGQPPQSPYQPQPQPGQPPQSPYQPQPQPGQLPQTPYAPQPQPGQPPQSPYQPQPQPGQTPQSLYAPQPQPGQLPYQPQPQPIQPSQPTTPYQPQPTYTPQTYQQTLPPAQPQPKPGQECGVRREVPGTKPDESGFGEFPWHAVIVSKSNSSTLCSAAIIAPNAVLTAAHCIEGLQPEDMKIKAGGFTLGQEGPKPTQIRQVGAAAIHPKYDSGSLVKDEAVIVTEEPLVFDTHIDKVCLAPSGHQDYQPTGRVCYVTGFGRPALQRGSVGTPLHKVPVELIPKDQCEEKLKKTHLGKYFILNQGFSCAVPPKESELCKVDVGSPLVCERADGKYELAGVYSWDTKCSTELPGITAACDTEWIQQVLATPIAQLRQQYNRPKIHATLIFTDIDSKPGFALGYGK